MFVAPLLLAYTPPRIQMEQYDWLYVDGTKGNDWLGDGSFNKPYRTIQRAMEAKRIKLII